jgi:hypothetical protein
MRSGQTVGSLPLVEPFPELTRVVVPLFLRSVFHASTFLPPLTPRVLPASSLLRRLCHLPGTVLRAFYGAWTLFPTQVVIPDSYRSNFRPFYLQPTYACLIVHAVFSTKIGGHSCVLRKFGVRPVALRATQNVQTSRQHDSILLG